MKDLILQLPGRKPLEILYRKDSTPEKNLSNIEALIIETNYGFNDLGLYTQLIAQHMDIVEDTFRKYADSLMKEALPTIEVVPTQNTFSPLKAVALVSSPNCDCYKPFESDGVRPNKDFFYNIVYEALSTLVRKGYKNIGIAGLTGSLRFVDDKQYRNSVAEAVCHAAHDFPSLEKIQIVSFGPIISYGIEYFNQFTDKAGLHKKISIQERELYGIKRITLNIPRRF